MARKSRIRLTDEQKFWFDNLTWYMQNKITWLGTNDESELKELMFDGKYAIFIMHEPHLWDSFDVLICTNTLESVDQIINSNGSPLFHVVDLGTLWVEKEVRKMSGPTFTNLIEKMQYDKDMEKYKELKKEFKGILKYFR